MIDIQQVARDLIREITETDKRNAAIAAGRIQGIEIFITRLKELHERDDPSRSQAQPEQADPAAQQVSGDAGAGVGS